ncbi:MAG: adenosylcobinamide-phosphate synthase CbiB [Pseudomonadota bacterium]
MFDPFTLIIAALLIDAVIGDPDAVYRRWPHPVALIGRLITEFEKYLYPASSTVASTDRPRHHQVRGTILALAVIALSATAGLALERLMVDWTIANVPLGVWGLAVIASTLLAARGLHDRVRAVGDALERSLDEARLEIRHLVGRDPQSLDRAAIARASIESAAENFVDAVVAPVCWFALLGIPGLVGYKAINTLDSMIGHRSERYEHFGKFAARLDDVANWVPARLGALLFAGAALWVNGANAGRALRWAITFAPRHRSVNAGWPEAAMAGALNLALAGPRQYDNERVEDAWMGRGNRDLDARDIARCLRLYRAAWCWLVVSLGLAGWLLS